MIREAVIARTGQRLLYQQRGDGLTSDEAMFRYLMDNAIASKQRLNLSVGVTLSAAQVAALTHDLVWLEEALVNGEKVLVPVLYLAQAKNRLAPNGALIQGQNVSLIAGKELNNAGTLRAANNLSASATNISNSGLMEAGQRLELLASDSIRNAHGGIISGRDVSITALTGDVLNERTVTQHAGASGRTWTQSFADSAARIEASNRLDIGAGRDIANLGGVLHSRGDLSLNAGRDVTIASVEARNSESRGSGYRREQITQLGAEVAAGRDLTATTSPSAAGSLSTNAGRDLSVIASKVEARRDLDLIAGRDVTLAAAANEDHYYSKSKKVTRQEDHVQQQSTEVKAGGDVFISSGQDLTLLASKVEAGEEAYLVAGNNLALLSAEDSDYSLYDMKKKGSWGSKKTQRDETTSVTNVGSEIKSGGDLTLVSGGDQLYQGAKLDSGNDLTLDSGGAITFEAVKDLKQESHEKSSNSWAWTSAKGKGTTDETLQQSQLIAQGDIVIKAVEGLKIDIKQVNQQSVTQTIDAMVKADPNLAWMKEMEQRGDVDWRQVKEVHESFKYSHSGLGGPAMIVIAIIVTYLTAGAASGLVAGAAGAGGASTAAGAAWATTVTTAAGTTAAGWANVAATAVLTSAASNAAISTINNRGNLGAVAKDVTSSDNLKGYATSALTAGVTAGVLDSAFGVTGDNVNKVTKGFDLSKAGDLTKFATYLGAQGAVHAVTQTAVQGGSLGDNLQNALTGQVQHLLQAGVFNAVGDFAGGKWVEGINWADGSPEKVALHAVVGGLLSEATGGDFKTGALAAGANELLIERLAGVIKGDKSLELTVSQLIGVAAATATGGDPAKAAELAKNATAYNQQVHREAKDRLERGLKVLQDQGKYLDLDAETVLKDLRKIAGGDVTSTAQLNPEVVKFLNSEFNPASIRDTLFEPEDWETYTAIAIDLVEPTPFGKAAAVQRIGEKVSKETLQALEHKFGDALKSGGVGAKAVDHSSELAVSANAARRHLRHNLGRGEGQAHHIIAWESRNHPLVQKAAKGGFNINGAENGIRLGSNQHLGSHSKYNNAIMSKLERLHQANSNMSPSEAASAVSGYINQLRTGLNRSSNKLR